MDPIAAPTRPQRPIFDPLRRLLPAALLLLAASSTLAAAPLPTATPAASPGSAPGPSPTAPANASPVPYQAVLIAGDNSLPVFDNAVSDVDGMLRRAGAATGVTRLSATPAAIAGGARPATLAAVLASVAALRPAPGQACLIYATSHGVSNRGLYLAAQEEVLTPAQLDRALQSGCSTAPTVVVISSCFSGLFAQGAMARPNRIILTAARADRTSFGCGAGRTYTVYDRCLLDQLGAGKWDGGAWPAIHAALRRCVATEERAEAVDQPSLPQAWFGPRAASLPAPRPTP